MPLRKWRMAPSIPPGSAPDLDAWPWPMPQLLYNRGLRTAAQVEEFIYPERVGMHDPFLLRGMDVAVERILCALRAGDLIGIYGDFDVDGLTGTALLMEVLGSPPLGGRVTAYLPHRLREGYGLNLDAIRTLAGEGVRLLITVDCGVGAGEEVRLAARLGMDVIITDHHRPSGDVSPVVAMLNPRQQSCQYPFKELAGVGVAYKLAEALLSRLWDPGRAREKLGTELDLVALGTVADLAPLVGENRLLAKLGLQQLGLGRRPGLRALLAGLNHNGRAVDAHCISYMLGPRLNAAGRMGDARLSLNLLMTGSEEEARRLAVELEAANRERQAAMSVALESARGELSRLEELPPAIVLAGDYSAGIVGLVASRLAEEFCRPSFVIERDEMESRGSGRGVPGFDVVKALSDASDLLTRFGGHVQAGGFSLRTSDLEAFQARLESAAQQQLGGVPVPELFLDARLRLGAIGPALQQSLDLLEPYGPGNGRPLFCSQRVVVRDLRPVGSGHLRLWLADDSGVCTAIGFGMAREEYSFIRPGALIDCAYTVGSNERGGTIGYEMVLRDVWKHGPVLAE